MKSCKDCRFAQWKRTTNGRLHPSGMGNCAFPWRMPAIPASMYWVPYTPPLLAGGLINRKENLKEHCAYYTRQTVIVFVAKVRPKRSR